MCPDKEILSAYVDNEVESPWREKLEVHLKECMACRQKFQELQNLLTMLREDPEPDYTPSMYRVKERLESSPWAIQKVITPFWKKRLLIPVPLAAIAASLLIGLSTVITVTLAVQKPGTTPTGTAVVESQAEPEDDELATVIKLMENQDFDNEVVIQLPSGSRFMFTGEPQLIRASDLNRSK